MNYTYELVPGGYIVRADGLPWVVQDFDPQKPFVNGAGQPFDSDAAAQAHAEALIASMTTPA